jgi:hypothetical protein
VTLSALADEISEIGGPWVLHGLHPVVVWPEGYHGAEGPWLVPDWMAGRSAGVHGVASRDGRWFLGLCSPWVPQLVFR